MVTDRKAGESAYAMACRIWEEAAMYAAGSAKADRAETALVPGLTSWS